MKWVFFIGYGLGFVEKTPQSESHCTIPLSKQLHFLILKCFSLCLRCAQLFVCIAHQKTFICFKVWASKCVDAGKETANGVYLWGLYKQTTKRIRKNCFGIAMLCERCTSAMLKASSPSPRSFSRPFLRRLSVFVGVKTTQTLLIAWVGKRRIRGGVLYTLLHCGYGVASDRFPQTSEFGLFSRSDRSGFPSTILLVCFWFRFYGVKTLLSCCNPLSATTQPKRLPVEFLYGFHWHLLD